VDLLNIQKSEIANQKSPSPPIYIRRQICLKGFTDFKINIFGGVLARRDGFFDRGNKIDGRSIERLFLLFRSLLV
jgi:hypothetical protein